MSHWAAPQVQTRRPHVVMYAGSMGAPNSIETLVRAAAETRALGVTEEEIVFRFVGHGASKEQAVELVRKLGIKGVSFEDLVAKEHVPELLSEATLLWMATRKSKLYDYGMSPNKLADYLTAGRPVVLAADVGGDDVENSGCGRTVRSNQPRIMAEAVLELCRLSDSDRHAMGLRGRRYAEENLSTVDLADRLNDVLVSAAASRT